MNRPNSLLVAGTAAVVLAGCASLLVYNFLKQYETRPFQGVSVVSAATDIPIGASLTEANVKTGNWPKEGVPEGSITTAKEVVGRVAVHHLSTGDIITEQKLMPLSATARSNVMTYIVPRGHRAVTVAVNEVAGVAGFIAPNNRVDVVLTSSPSGSDSSTEKNVSKVILQNIPVLATGQVTEQKEGKPTVVPTVTLDLLPADAEKLIVGTKKGSLQLLLRNLVDTAEISTRGATVSSVMGSATDRPVRLAAAKSTRPVPPPTVRQTVQTVEVFRGGLKSTREFPAD